MGRTKLKLEPAGFKPVRDFNSVDKMASSGSQESLVNGLNTSHLNDGETIEKSETTSEKVNIFELSNEIELKLDSLMSTIDKNEAETEAKIDKLMKRVISLEKKLTS